MRSWTLAAALVLLLPAACSKPADSGGSVSADAPAEAVAANDAATIKKDGLDTGGAIPVSVPKIAYTYAYGYRVPAADLVKLGAVTVAGEAASKPGMLLAPDAELAVAPGASPYVSRGGLKLDAALDAFGLDPEGLVALDLGASTGGGTGAGTAHDTSGTAPNTATVTSWCGELFVQANITAGFAPYPYPECPASLNEVTAIMAVPFYNQTPRLLPANTVFAIKLPMQPVANLASNIYTNIFTFSAPGMVGSPVTSNGSTTKVVAPDLTLAKTANPTQAKAGDAVDFAVGVECLRKEGDRVGEGEPILRVHSRQAVDPAAVAARTLTVA